MKQCHRPLPFYFPATPSRRESQHQFRGCLPNTRIDTFCATIVLKVLCSDSHFDFPGRTVRVCPQQHCERGGRGRQMPWTLPRDFWLVKPLIKELESPGSGEQPPSLLLSARPELRRHTQSTAIRAPLPGLTPWQSLSRLTTGSVPLFCSHRPPATTSPYPV